MATTLKSLATDLELTRSMVATLPTMADVEALKAEITALRAEIAELKAQRPAPSRTPPAARADRPAPYQPNEVISVYPSRRSPTGYAAKVQDSKPGVTREVPVDVDFADNFAKGQQRGVFIAPAAPKAKPADKGYEPMPWDEPQAA